MKIRNYRKALRLCAVIIGSLFLLGAVTDAAVAQTKTKFFSKTLKLQGVTFTVMSPNQAANNTVKITTKGLTRNEVFNEKADGIVTGVDVEDTNSDGSPELYIYIKNNQTNAGSLLAYSTNKKASMTPIYLPEIEGGAKELNGYRGRDEYKQVEGTIVRTFPIYKPGDKDTKATGGTRQFQYKLIPGEAGWQLKLDKVFDY